MFDGGGHTSMMWLKGLLAKILQDYHYKKIRPVKSPQMLFKQHTNVPNWASRDVAVVRALASHQCDPGFDSRTRRHMWVEFVVGSRSCSERFFSGYSSFPLSSKTNTSKFQLDLESVPN